METKQISPETECLAVGFLSTEALCFFRTPNGFLALKQNGTELGRVTVYRALPFAAPERYISVHDTEDKEIGILEDIGELPPEQGELVREELAKRYFCPEITAIHSIKEKFGYFYFDVSIGNFRKNFAVKDISRSVRTLENGEIAVTDIDGSRYRIPSLRVARGKTRKAIEPYLY